MAIDYASPWHWFFWLIASCGSLLYGFKACAVFEVNPTGKPFAWKVHQFWFNSLGAFIGWIAAWPLLGSIAACAKLGCSTEITASSATLFLLAFVGVTGHLPLAIFGLLGGLKELVSKLLSVGGGKP
jgi:hypothetical protein